MSSQKIRRSYLDYFKKKGHTIVPSSPVIPHDDPTLLFINAGMNQFKDVFLGKSVRDYKRAASSQKCIRVGGKHNDLENVGHTSRHLTFFEMLGNFSFGDYFKKEAIDFAWDVTCSVFGYDPNKIWATVFFEDEEAFELWKRYLPEARIARMGEKDNFWAMGDTGPCGPCSELLFDRGEGFGHARSPSEDIKGERFLEFWNLVFMQFNKDPSGKKEPLPKPCVDTGAGLERVVSIQMGVDSLFETDILRSLIAQVENISGVRYDPTGERSPAFRVIADHLRALSFAIADGVQPSNLDRGYVLRKVLRRAVRYGRQLNLDKPFLADVLPRLVDIMGDDFPELRTAQGRIAEILTQEEEGFLRTLKRGGNLLSQIIESSKKHANLITGADAFKLKDTYGLPLEEILLLAKDANLTVDIGQFELLEKEAKERSRQTRKKTDLSTQETLFSSYAATHGPTVFSGYESLSIESTILGLVKEGTQVDVLHEGETGIVLLSQTPFYAEKGGQIGDQGFISSQGGTFEVLDCQQPYTEVFAHEGIVRKGKISLGEKVTATVDGERRQKIANHHTATHLLHWALQLVLGKHVRQAGSIVEPNRLRFDFSHHKALSAEELDKIETLVNEKVRENKPVVIYELAYEEVQKRQEIQQFFGEKYGSKVRVIDIDFSKELCGGTHVKATGQIGYFRITKEASISAGVRRIEAVTGQEAETFVKKEEKALTGVCERLKSQPAQIEERIEQLIEENKQLATQMAELRKEMLKSKTQKWLDNIETIASIPFLAQVVTPAEMKDAGDLLIGKNTSLILLLIAIDGEKCSLLTRISSDLVSRGFAANQLIQTLAPLIEGKGGGRPDNAQAGGKKPIDMQSLISKAREWVKKTCS